MSGHFSGRLNTAARGWASDVSWFGRAVAALAFCETVSWPSIRDTSWVTSEATWDSHASHGDGQCWLSLRLSCRGSSACGCSGTIVWEQPSLV